MKNQAEFIIRAFEDLEVPLNPTSRLGKQVEFYLDHKGTLPQFVDPDHPLHPTGVEGYRDLSQVAFALANLLPTSPKVELKRRLRKLVEDNVLPQHSPDRSPGRDTQCELFVAGLCARGRLDPVFNESPDLRCQLAGGTLGIAVKRIKAAPERFPERFRERIREAAGQIAKSRIPGIIITDISQSLNPTNWWVPVEVSDAEFNAAWQAQMVQLKRHFEAQLLDWTQGKDVRGVIFIDHILRCLPTKVWRMELFGASIGLCRFNQRRRREFESFDNRFMWAVCNPGDPRH